jgi:uncharacterized membrane protein HdeD (DUF308 family)
MKKRNPYFVAIMSLITLGIYQIYWLVVTKNEMVRRGAKIPTIFLVFAPLLGLLLVAVLQIVVRFAIAGNNDNSLKTITNVVSVLIGIVALLALIPFGVYWFYKYCKGVEHVTEGQTSLELSFWMGLAAWLLGVQFIWSGVIQNRFNDQVKQN